jgi:hypothetical protein
MSESASSSAWESGVGHLVDQKVIRLRAESIRERWEPDGEVKYVQAILSAVSDARRFVLSGWV